MSLSDLIASLAHPKLKALSADERKIFRGLTNEEIEILACYCGPDNRYFLHRIINTVIKNETQVFRGNLDHLFNVMKERVFVNPEKVAQHAEALTLSFLTHSSDAIWEIASKYKLLELFNNSKAASNFLHSAFPKKGFENPQSRISVIQKYNIPIPSINSDQTQSGSVITLSAAASSAAASGLIPTAQSTSAMKSAALPVPPVPPIQISQIWQNLQQKETALEKERAIFTSFLVGEVGRLKTEVQELRSQILEKTQHEKNLLSIIGSKTCDIETAQIKIEALTHQIGTLEQTKSANSDKTRELEAALADANQQIQTLREETTQIPARFANFVSPENWQALQAENEAQKACSNALTKQQRETEEENQRLRTFVTTLETREREHDAMRSALMTFLQRPNQSPPIMHPPAAPLPNPGHFTPSSDVAESAAVEALLKISTVAASSAMPAPEVLSAPMEIDSGEEKKAYSAAAAYQVHGFLSTNSAPAASAAPSPQKTKRTRSETTTGNKVRKTTRTTTVPAPPSA